MKEADCSKGCQWIVIMAERSDGGKSQVERADHGKGMIAEKGLII